MKKWKSWKDKANWLVECECGYEAGGKDSVEASRKAGRHSYACFKETTIREKE